MFYIIEFILGYALLLYDFWKSPGLFPFSILFDGIIALYVTLIIFGISLILSKLLRIIIKNDKKIDKCKLEKISFTIIFIIMFMFRNVIF